MFYQHPHSDWRKEAVEKETLSSSRKQQSSSSMVSVATRRAVSTTQDGSPVVLFDWWEAAAQRNYITQPAFLKQFVRWKGNFNSQLGNSQVHLLHPEIPQCPPATDKKCTRGYQLDHIPVGIWRTENWSKGIVLGLCVMLDINIT